MARSIALAGRRALTIDAAIGLALEWSA